MALNTGQRDTLADSKINPITFITGTGLVNYGQYTRAKNASALDRINVARLVIFLRRQLTLLAKPYVFEPNDANTWTAVNASVSNFLTGIWQQGGLFGQGPQDAFQVKIGLGSTMTADDLLNGNMCILIEVALIRPAEFLVITIQQQMAAS